MSSDLLPGEFKEVVEILMNKINVIVDNDLAGSGAVTPGTRQASILAFAIVSVCLILLMRLSGTVFMQVAML